MENDAWLLQLPQYEGSDFNKNVKQILTTFIPYFILMFTMFGIVHQGYSYGLVLLLCPLAGLFTVRMFIILHDCAHKTYFKGSPSACFLWGHICGMFTFTAFFDFRQTHVLHHATVANLEKRGVGDIWTMTVGEYQQAPLWIKLGYRLYRNPFFLFLVAPTFEFLLVNRFPKRVSRLPELLSILFEDLVIVLMVLVAYFTIGIKSFIAVQLPVLFLAANMGVWIFYIHHQFENVYWSRAKDWDRIDAAIKGSSFYKFPDFIEWFTGHIGYHFIHHLNYRIPNYNLEKCYREIPQLQIKPRTFIDGVKSMFLALWDEKTGTLVSFSSLKPLNRF